MKKCEASFLAEKLDSGKSDDKGQNQLLNSQYLPDLL
jgi:hypothetical protein